MKPAAILGAMAVVSAACVIVSVVCTLRVRNRVVERQPFIVDRDQQGRWIQENTNWRLNALVAANEPVLIKVVGLFGALLSLATIALATHWHFLGSR